MLFHSDRGSEYASSEINAYNTTLITIDNVRSDIKTRERTLGDLAEQRLIGVAFQ